MTLLHSHEDGVEIPHERLSAEAQRKVRLEKCKGQLRVLASSTKRTCVDSASTIPKFWPLVDQSSKLILRGCRLADIVWICAVFLARALLELKSGSPSLSSSTRLWTGCLPTKITTATGSRIRSKDAT